MTERSAGHQPVAGWASARVRHGLPLKPTLVGLFLAVAGLAPPLLYPTVGLAEASTGTWSPATALDQCTPASPSCTGRDGHVAVLLKSGQVLVAGGAGSPMAQTTAQLFDPAKGTWSPTASLEGPMISATATELPDGKVLLVGDTGPPRLFDPGSGAWSTTGPTTTGRGAHTATLLKTGKVLVAGGNGSSLGTATAELYDPATATWSATGSMIELRLQHVAALLQNGRVLVAGGWSENYGPKRRTAELYDPETGTWAPTGPTTTTPTDATATTLTSGQVLLAGGESSESNSVNGGDRDAQLYDPATGSWTPTGAMLAGRSVHTATLLPDGNVLVAGGNATVQGRDPEPISKISAELYNTASRTWTAAAPLAITRYRHTATLLPAGPDGRCGPNCGQVLVAGGKTLVGGRGTPVSAELYAAPPAPAPTPTPAAGRNPGPQAAPASSGTSLVGVYLAGGALVAAVACGGFVLRRRRRQATAEEADGASSPRR